ncbi:MAG: prolyl oligopeptidase family serine peptidase [Planctomycetota bacterium]
MTKWLVRGGMVAALCLLSIQTASAVECRLSPDGAITTWLIAPVFPYDPDAGFEKDLLPKKMGETSGFRRAEGGGPVEWRGRAFNDSFVNLHPHCLKRGESVIYAACELRAREAGTYDLFATFYAKGAAWLDGKRVFEEGEDDPLLVRKTAKVKLEKGKAHHLLLKVASSGPNAFFNLSFIKPGDGPRPIPVDVVLRVPDEREAGLLEQSLALSAPGASVVRAGAAVPARVHAPAGLPALEGEVTVRAMIVDHEGRCVRQFEPRKIDAKDFAGGAVALPWLVPEDAKAPTYTVRADVLYRGGKIAELNEVFYVAEGVSAWMRGLQKRLTNAELQLEPRQRYTEPDVALAQLKIEKAQLYARSEADAGESAANVVAELKACDLAVTRLEKHKRRPLDVRGLTEHAYISSIDDSPQPYYVYVPNQHDGIKHLPVIVYLHGYNPELNKLNWEMIPPSLLDYCDKHGYYLVAPFARSNTDFQGVGEVDVIHVFQLLALQYPIDADRVFLFGYSMGGMGTFTIGGHYPDVWAGIVALSSRADYYLWQDLDREKVEPYKRHLIDAEFGAEMAGNFRSLPILMYHGREDTLVKPEQPRRLAATLKKMGADVTLRELEGEDHWILSRVLRDDAVFKWMAERKRDARPPEVDFITRTIKYRRAYWVTVLELARWGEPVKVHAKFNADKTALDVTTRNVASLRLDLSKELVGEGPKLVVKVNGKERKIGAPGPATFDIEPAARAGKLRKTPRLCGPVKEAYNRRFTIVVGAGEGKQADVARFRGELQRAAIEWLLFTKSMPLVKIDAQVTAADIGRSNLILYGTPSDNSVLRKIAGKLPVKITGQGFEFQGKKYSGEDHGLVMVYPNPLNPARLVVVRSGLPHGGGLSPNHKLDLLPDFVIFRKGVDYDKTNQAVVAGFFDENWQVAERLIWRRDKDAADPWLNKPEPEEEPVDEEPAEEGPELED